MTTTEETTMDERDVEQVARAICKALRRDRSEWVAYVVEARAAMAARDEQLRARLVSEEAVEVMAGGESATKVARVQLTAPPFVEPAPTPASDEPSESDVRAAWLAFDSMRYDHGSSDPLRAALKADRARRLAPLPMAVDREAIAKWYRARLGDLAVQPSKRSLVEDQDLVLAEVFSLGAEAAFAAVESSDGYANGVNLSDVIAEARASLRLPAAPPPMAAPVTDAEVSHACEAAYAVPGLTNMRAALTAFAAGRVASDDNEVGALRARASRHDEAIRSLDELRKAVRKAAGVTGVTEERALGRMEAAIADATRRAEQAEAEVARLTAALAEANRERTEEHNAAADVIHQRSKDVERLTAERDAATKRADAVAVRAGNERLRAETAEAVGQRANAALAEATKRAKEAESARDEGQRAAAGWEKQCRAAERRVTEWKAAASQVALRASHVPEEVRTLMDVARRYFLATSRGAASDDMENEMGHAIDDAEAAIASQPDADAQAGEACPDERCASTLTMNGVTHRCSRGVDHPLGASQLHECDDVAPSLIWSEQSADRVDLAAIRADMKKCERVLSRENGIRASQSCRDLADAVASMLRREARDATRKGGA